MISFLPLFELSSDPVKKTSSRGSWQRASLTWPSHRAGRPALCSAFRAAAPPPHPSAIVTIQVVSPQPLPGSHTPKCLPTPPPPLLALTPSPRGLLLPARRPPSSLHPTLTPTKQATPSSPPMPCDVPPPRVCPGWKACPSFSLRQNPTLQLLQMSSYQEVLPDTHPSLAWLQAPHPSHDPGFSLSLLLWATNLLISPPRWEVAVSLRPGHG